MQQPTSCSPNQGVQHVSDVSTNPSPPILDDTLSQGGTSRDINELLDAAINGLPLKSSRNIQETNMANVLDPGSVGRNSLLETSNEKQLSMEDERTFKDQPLDATLPDNTGEIQWGRYDRLPNAQDKQLQTSFAPFLTREEEKLKEAKEQFEQQKKEDKELFEKHRKEDKEQLEKQKEFLSREEEKLKEDREQFEEQKKLLSWEKERLKEEKEQFEQREKVAEGWRTACIVVIVLLIAVIIIFPICCNDFVQETKGQFEHQRKEAKEHLEYQRKECLRREEKKSEEINILNRKADECHKVEKDTHLEAKEQLEDLRKECLRREQEKLQEMKSLGKQVDELRETEKGCHLEINDLKWQVVIATYIAIGLAILVAVMVMPKIRYISSQPMIGQSSEELIKKPMVQAVKYG